MKEKKTQVLKSVPSWLVHSTVVWLSLLSPFAYVAAFNNYLSLSLSGIYTTHDSQLGNASKFRTLWKILSSVVQNLQYPQTQPGRKKKNETVETSFVVKHERVRSSHTLVGFKGKASSFVGSGGCITMLFSFL